MIRILAGLVVLIVLGTGGALLWGGLFLPAAAPVSVTHQIGVSQLVDR